MVAARSREIVDSVVSANHGARPVELVDAGHVSLFGRAVDALAAAAEISVAFDAEPWPSGLAPRLRQALHSAEAAWADTAASGATTLDRARCLGAIAYNGQTLLTASAAAGASGGLPDGVALVDLGMHRLKDLGRSEHVWQMNHVGLRGEFPPLRSLDFYRHNLPVQLSTLVGRARDIKQVCSLLGEAGLVTLTGTAGVGKTRLAAAVGAESVGARAGVWWIDLSSISDGDAVGRAVLVALGAADIPGASTSARIADAVGGPPALIVLDNCEHLVEACALLVAELLRLNPAVAIIATSREPLGVPGEIVWRVPSLPCPGSDVPLNQLAVSQYDAVALFVDRARRARPTFGITDANCSAIAQICGRLDGIPLAIELAAARCRQLPVERIAIELDDRFRLLMGGARTVMARQQTLMASLDWSHDRLDDRERIVFRRLAAFNGLFPLEAAEAIVAESGEIDSEAVFEQLARLVDKSLVVADDSAGGQAAYRLLESLRAYAIDKARIEGEIQTLRDQHARWWAEWLAARADNPKSSTLEEVERFYDNVRAAMMWSVESAQLGLPFLHDFAGVAQEFGRAGDAVAAADSLLTDENAASHPEMWLAAAGATLIRYDVSRSFTELLAFASRVEEVAAAHEDAYHLALSRLFASHDVNAAIRLRDLAASRGEQYVAAVAAILVAQTIANDDPQVGLALLLEAEQFTAGVNSDMVTQFDRRVRGYIARDTGCLDEAITLARALTTSRSGLMAQSGFQLLSLVGLLARDDDALGDAAFGVEDLVHPREDDFSSTRRVRHRLALLRGTGGSRALRRTPDSPWMRPGTAWLECREAIDAGAPDVVRQHLDNLDQTLPHGAAITAAIQAATGQVNRWYDALRVATEHGLRLIAVDALEGIAVSAGEANPVECLRLVAAAERQRDETGYRWRFECEQRAITTIVEAVEAALGPAATAVARNEGSALDWNQAADLALRARGARHRPHHGWNSLTPTEQSVVELAAQGLSNAEIAQRLLMGRATVKSHLEHIYTKVGVRNRTGLAVEVARHDRP